MIEIIFESHSTSIDNEQQRASGHADVALSEQGIQQAADLGHRYEQVSFDTIFCSDLQRSYRTAEMAFAHKSITIIQDARLRECDYGDYTQRPNKDIESVKYTYVEKPFPNGESYREAILRIKNFLEDLSETHHRKVMIIGHHATQYGLEYYLNNASLEKVLTTQWKWQPGWKYLLESRIPLKQRTKSE